MHARSDRIPLIELLLVQLKLCLDIVSVYLGVWDANTPRVKLIAIRWGTFVVKYL
jgi:hypothetical protein